MLTSAWKFASEYTNYIFSTCWETFSNGINRSLAASDSWQDENWNLIVLTVDRRSRMEGRKGHCSSRLILPLVQTKLRMRSADS